MMDKKSLEKFKAKLLALRRKYNKEFHMLEEEGPHIPLKEAAGGNVSAYPTHLADIASEASQIEEHILIMGNISEILQQVNEALYRIEKGEYGICEVCGGEIEEKRLEIIPYTNKCSRCIKKT